MLPTVRDQWDSLVAILREQGYPDEKIERAKPLFDYCMTASVTITVAVAQRYQGDTTQFVYWLQQLEAEALAMGYVDAIRVKTRPPRKPPRWQAIANFGAWAVTGVFIAASAIILVEFGRMVLDTQSFCHGQGYIEVR